MCVFTCGRCDVISWLRSELQEVLWALLQLEQESHTLAVTVTLLLLLLRQNVLDSRCGSVHWRVGGLEFGRQDGARLLHGEHHVCLLHHTEEQEALDEVK